MPPKQKKLFCNVCCNDVAELMSCAKCNDSACLSCVKNFIFSGLRQHACCMFCNNVFTKEFLFASFPPSWMGMYKNYQKKFAIDREEALLPSTVEYAAVVKQ